MRLIKRILCLFGYHKYFLIKELRPYSRKIGCKYCKKQFMMNDDCKCVLEWDQDFEDLEKRISEDLAKI